MKRGADRDDIREKRDTARKQAQGQSETLASIYSETEKHPEGSQQKSNFILCGGKGNWEEGKAAELLSALLQWEKHSFCYQLYLRAFWSISIKLPKDLISTSHQQKTELQHLGLLQKYDISETWELGTENPGFESHLIPLTG